MSDLVIINFIHIDCARNYAIYRAIDAQLESRDLNSNFWRVARNSCRDMAIIQWCKLFGSWSETTHWKNHSFIKDFEIEILKKTNISYDLWKKIHDCILEYRDKNVAHIDLDDWERNIPFMSLAMEILYCSYDAFISPSYNNLNLRDEFIRVFDDTKQAFISSSIK